MKKLEALPDDNGNMAIIKQKKPEYRHIAIGIALCAVIAVILFLLSQKVTSEKAELTKKGEEIYSPVDGIVYEVLVRKGDTVRKGDALIHYDPMYIRTKVAEIREYLQAFKENRHNPGTLKQIFKPLLGEAFAGISQEVVKLSELEAAKLKELQKLNREQAKAQVAMRRPSTFIDGKPDPKLVEQEKEVQKKIDEAEQTLQDIATARALADKKYRDLTNSLGQSNSVLYRYLEEEYNKALALERNEYLYAPFNAVAGISHVQNGSMVQKDQLVMEIHPKNSQEWWVRAIFAEDDAKSLKERDVCTVITEDGEEMDARIFSMEKGKDEEKGKTIVKLYILEPPQDLQPSEFVTVKSK